MTRAFQEAQIRRYLLGGMTASEEQELETAFFRDAELLARVELARDDLADDYAAGRLSAVDREKFERHILASDEGRKQLAITRALRNAAGARSKSPGNINGGSTDGG
jgi:anti-sigma-K factor RskA